MRQRNYYHIFDKVPSSVHKQLQALGLKHIEPIGLGAGPDEIKEVIIAWITLHPILSSIFLGVLANRIDKLIDVLFNWYKNHQKKRNVLPIVQFFIYPNFFSKDDYRMKIRIDRKHTQNDIKKELKEAINVYNEYLRGQKKL